MRTHYVIENNLRVLDILVIVISSTIAQRLVTKVPLLPDSPIIPLIVAWMPLVTYLVAREIARHSSALQPSDWWWVLKRDWSVTIGCILMLLVGVVFNSWATLIPIVSAFVLYRINSGYKHMNEALMGLFVYRFIWYVIPTIVVAGVSYSLSAPHFLGYFLAASFGFELMAVMARTLR